MNQALIAAIASLPDELPELNEQSVREEILAPILKALGYSSFGENQINRERTIRYPYTYLGRKGKKGEAKLSAKPDYELDAGPNHRIVIEAKSTKADISEDDIDQAYSYAAHPEVKAVIYIVTNAKTFLIFHTYNANPYEPIRTLAYSELKFLPEAFSFLSPLSVQRHYPLPRQDFGVPIIKEGGSSRMKGDGQLAFSYGENIILGQYQDMEVLTKDPSDLLDCIVARDAEGRIKAHFETMSQNIHIRAFQETMGFNTVNVFSHDKYISTDAKRPTLFTGDYHLILEAGTKMLNPEDGVEIIVPFDFMVLQRFSALMVVNDYMANFLFEGRMSIYTAESSIGSGKYVGGGQIKLIESS